MPTFGAYELIGRLATGGTSEVFLAESIAKFGFKKTVALKMLLPQCTADEGFVAMFMDEARNVARLAHANIVQVTELGEHHGRYFIAMEYVAGPTLATLSETLPAGAAMTILEDVLAALDFAHQHGIVHRDVRPHNIMIGTDGVTKVTDFGIAKARTNVARTKSGTLKGHFSYMSPEQARGKPVDRRSDVFAAGLVAYELFAGHRAYDGEDEMACLQAAQQAMFEPLPQSAVAGVVHRALERSPDARFQSCAEMARALRETGASFFERHEIIPLVAPFRVTPEPVDVADLVVQRTQISELPRRSRMLPAAIVLALAAVTAALLFFRDEAPPPTVEQVAWPPTSVPVVVPKGYMSINARPWATVYIDGVLVARSTPLHKHAVAAGAHEVELIASDGRREKTTVTVGPGETVTHAVRF